MPSPVVVTGASGFIASWVLKQLLESGAQVRATVRALNDHRRVAHLKALGDAAPGQLTLFEADLLRPGSFAEAMRGAAAVVHLASPFVPVGVRDPEAELIRPAVEGTRNVLQSVEQTPSVRSVVLTSSMAATYGDARDLEQLPGGRVDEACWNATSTPSHQAYAFSKTLAEREAWRLAKAQRRWRLATILPGFVVGPSLSTRTDATSTDMVLQMLDGRNKGGVPDLRFAMVDVRDVARAHVEALRRPTFEGRCIVGAEPLGFGDLAGMLREQYPERASLPRRCMPPAMLYLAAPFVGLSWRFLKRNIGADIAFDNARSRAELGLEYGPVRAALLAQADQLLASSA
jgi:nucleoside-diphosphate-sugar epimerase